MSEEPKNIRLNKAAKELNVGIPTMVEYLSRKGHHIDANPNARLTPEQYALLATTFQTVRQVKEKADSIEISTANSVVIEATQNKDNDDSVDYSDEVIIKNFNTPKTKGETSKAQPASSESDSNEGKAAKDVDTGDVETKEQEKDTEPQAPKFETKVLRSSVAGVKEGKNAFDAEVRIVDKIDLSAINSRMRPTKSSKNKNSDSETGKKKGEKSSKQAKDK
ncbi:MAG: hypothetical protein J6W61_05540, partial [Bacteroidales bacterium]|nr:hypothetical protein [Bacteroidales bacterium]